ncbi:hypothetical protein CA13_02110 [Planctomycetes bacterium CA13]|uniref:DUF2271 domain-containing protein n=1 Tax=Novipirellula herctigrandis TaxID=2527986 RepID=A0A5C5YUX5_9BACT|nr:hypothetical protein CA13_02110 [Planctomycetes bacterium CA13]
MKPLTTAMLCLTLSSVGWAEDIPSTLETTIEIRHLDVSEYHRPYVAVWIQDEDRNAVASLAVWYQITGSRKDAGTKWLPDLRQWWRRTGRSLEMPVDGVSGATRPAGTHKLSFAITDSRLVDLPAGKYSLVVEAAREVGGRELVEIPFTWPLGQSKSLKAKGKNELGEVTLNAK